MQKHSEISQEEQGIWSKQEACLRWPTFKIDPEDPSVEGSHMKQVRDIGYIS